jgi:hypothetical protein
LGHGFDMFLLMMPVLDRSAVLFCVVLWWLFPVTSKQVPVVVDRRLYPVCEEGVVRKPDRRKPHQQWNRCVGGGPFMDRWGRDKTPDTVTETETETETDSAALATATASTFTSPQQQPCPSCRAGRSAQLAQIPWHN